MANSIISDKQAITRRTFIIGLGQIGLLFLLVGRMFYMQFIKKDEYKTLSDKNRIKMILILPMRGEIFDCQKQVLAKNQSCFRLLLDKNTNSDFQKEIELLATILELDLEQIEEVQKRVKRAGRRIASIVIDCLKWSQLAVIEERRSEFEALFIDTGFQRHYPYADVTCHLAGYLGRPKNTESESLSLDEQAFKVGKNGLEKFYETDLRGNLGVKRVEVNAHGKYVRELGNIKAQTGANLYLNIDAQLQQKALTYLNIQGGSAIVMDCTNGSVLVCASAPTFDPNQFNKLSSKYWEELTNNPYKPLINKTISSLYPPGSIFKIITCLAALECGIDPKYEFICTGQPFLGGNSFRCAKKTGHGAINMIDALKYSCNSYMYMVARQIGAEKIIETAKKLGFGQLTGIDLPGELNGLVPTPQWKKEKFGTSWTLGDTLNLAIGQGFILVTPIQLARFIGAIANQGKLFTPSLMVKEPNYIQAEIAPEHLDTICQALYSTVNAAGSTGYLSKLNHEYITMSGKTGTAQVKAKKNSADDLSRESIAWGNRNHAIFSGYVPSNNPKYAISIYFDHGGGGGRSAAPIAKKIMQDVVNKYLPTTI